MVITVTYFSASSIRVIRIPPIYEEPLSSGGDLAGGEGRDNCEGPVKLGAHTLIVQFITRSLGPAAS